MRALKNNPTFDWNVQASRGAASLDQALRLTFIAVGVFRIFNKTIILFFITRLALSRGAASEDMRTRTHCVGRACITRMDADYEKY